CGFACQQLQICVCLYLIWHLFFFQAEDGIRDLYVTGVQTCALPISAVAVKHPRDDGARRPLHDVGVGPLAREQGVERRERTERRSEERRVGKECRTRWSAYH